MDHAELLRCVQYSSETGEFIRLQAAGNQAAGSLLGNPDSKGYLKAKVLGEYVRLNRLAWFYVHGVWPTHDADHKNQVKVDNRIGNLRDCTTSVNCTNQSGPRINNKMGLQGVHRISKTGRFRACCTIAGVKHHLGVYATADEAHATYRAFKAPHLPTPTPQP